MKINKPLDIDLNIISPQKHIRIHEGDVDSVDILIGVTVDDESVDLDGVTIKYDATINNYLAEQDADGSVVNDKISIPVTQNMTAMSGLLLIDVRMIQSDQVLFTQTICATVEKAVVNGSTYIDFDKITIVQRMNALEEKMDYIEELVENFDTSKLIVSANRPPSGAPVEVDVDLLRVGDTWILSGANIVYKLVEAQYNYQPVPSAEPYHKFIWQPLNERYGVDNTEPPTSVTYQAVVYTINEVQWSWLPVPEYFKGDHYLMQIGVDEPPTYYICKSGTWRLQGVCTYTWREEGGSIDAYTKAETNALLEDKEDSANKTNAITDSNKSSTSLYPSVKAVVDYSYPVIETDIDPLGHTGVLVGKVGQVAHYSGDGKLYVCYYVGQYEGSETNYYNWTLLPLPDSATIEGTLSETDSGGYSDTNFYVRSTTRLYDIWKIWKKFRVVKVNCSYIRYGTLYDTGAVCYITGVCGGNHDKISGVLILNAGNSSSKYQRVHVMEQIGEGSDDTLDLSTKYTLPSYDSESTDNKVTAISAQSTDTQYPSAKCVYDMIGDIETLLSEV